MQTQGLQVWGSAGLFPALRCVITLWQSPRAVKVPRACGATLGCGTPREFLPCKGIGVRRVWHWTPCPELKTNWWHKSGSDPVRSSFPFSTGIDWRWPWVANFQKPSAAQFFLNLPDLGCFLNFASSKSMSDLLTLFFSWTTFSTHSDSCQATFCSRDGEGLSWQVKGQCIVQCIV